MNKYLRILNINDETNTSMAEEHRKREHVAQNIKLIQAFDGDANYYISDYIYTALTRRFSFLHCI